MIVYSNILCIFAIEDRMEVISHLKAEAFTVSSILF